MADRVKKLGKLKATVKRIRTPEGAKKYGGKIGDPIEAKPPTPTARRARRLADHHGEYEVMPSGTIYFDTRDEDGYDEGLPADALSDNDFQGHYRALLGRAHGFDQDNRPKFLTTDDDAAFNELEFWAEDRFDPDELDKVWADAITSLRSRKAAASQKAAQSKKPQKVPDDKPDAAPSTDEAKEPEPERTTWQRVVADIRAITESDQVENDWQGAQAAVAAVIPNAGDALDPATVTPDEWRELDAALAAFRDRRRQILVDQQNRRQAAIDQHRADINELARTAPRLDAALGPAVDAETVAGGWHIARAMSGRYGPFEVRFNDEPRVDMFSPGSRGVSIGGSIMTPGGDFIGTIKRKFSRDANGDLTVENAYLALDPDYQGMGFSKAYAQAVEQFYREQGVASITLHANLDKGGKAWAQADYDWDYNGKNQPYYGNVVNRIDNELSRRDLSEADRAQLNDIRAAFIDPEGAPPTPKQIVELIAGDGRKMGESIMNSRAHWHGRKQL